ncbi:reactive intermediate/imine deaminase [Candidatus Desantisbacteria bacterium]|nr:reactive intermediate/imine deaminase [Candidatus Desantisbacteria bacterium]
MKRIIGTNPESPYSQAVAFKDLLFISGQCPKDLETGEIKHGSIEEQVRLTMENLKHVLNAGGSSLNNVLKVTVFLADMNDFDSMNKIYKEYFLDDKPARSCIQAARLPFEIKVEIEAIAYIPEEAAWIII